MWLLLYSSACHTAPADVTQYTAVNWSGVVTAVTSSQPLSFGLLSPTTVVGVKPAVGEADATWGKSPEVLAVGHRGRGEPQRCDGSGI